MVLVYLDHEHHARKGSWLNLQEWTLQHAKNVPRQKNDYDCGLFMIKYGQYFSRGRSDGEMDFKQEDMPYYRRRMIWEIKEKTLLWP